MATHAKKQLARALLGAAILAIALPAGAALPVVTFSTTGTVAEGTDELNLFHAGQGGSLVGQRFTMAISVDADTLELVEASDKRTYLRDESAGASATGELTVNGRTYTWSMSAANASVLMARPMEWFGARPDSASMSAFGLNAADGNSVSASTQVVSLVTPFMSGVDIARNVVFDTGVPGVESRASFFTTHYTGETHPGGPVTVSTWFRAQNPLSNATWIATPIPEPGMYAMLLAGIVAIRLRYRRCNGSRSAFALA